MKAWLFSLLHVVRTSLSYVVGDPPEWLSWLVLTVLLALPVYFVLEILGFGSGPKPRPASEDALDRIVAATDEIPEARRFTTRLRK